MSQASTCHLINWPCRSGTPPCRVSYCRNYRPPINLQVRAKWTEHSQKLETIHSWSTRQDIRCLVGHCVQAWGVVRRIDANPTSRTCCSVIWSANVERHPSSYACGSILGREWMVTKPFCWLVLLHGDSNIDLKPGTITKRCDPFNFSIRTPWHCAKRRK